MKNNRVRTRWHLRGLNIVRTLLLVGLTLAVSLGLVSARWVTAHAVSGSPALVSQANCSPSVKVVSSPNPGSASNGLIWIEVVSASNTWAVGYFQNTTGPGKTLIEHWNGSSWKVVSSPNPGSANNALFGMEAISASNIWAVGRFSNTTGPSQTLIEHWNGSRWKVVSSPSPGSVSNNLQGIKAVSANDVWAVGSFSNTTAPPFQGFQNLIEHWNGSRWSVVPSPNPGSVSNILNEIEAVSASDIWAVGGFSNTTPPSFQELQTLVEHWNGSSWSVVPSPSPGSSANQLGAIEAVSNTTLWAVAGLSNTTGPSKTLIEKIVCG